MCTYFFPPVSADDGRFFSPGFQRLGGIVPRAQDRSWPRCIASSQTTTGGESAPVGRNLFFHQLGQASDEFWVRIESRHHLKPQDPVTQCLLPCFDVNFMESLDMLRHKGYRDDKQVPSPGICQRGLCCREEGLKPFGCSDLALETHSMRRYPPAPGHRHSNCLL